jgi:putative phage-type endonuclease
MRQIGAGLELLPPEAARTPEWFQARRNGITASEIAAILGLSKSAWNSPLALYFRKRSEIDDDYDDDYRMALGRALEPYVLECFTTATGIETQWCGLTASMERPWQLATPDEVAGHIPVEAKTALNEDGWGPSGSSEIPLYYRCQLMYQMDVLGADHGYMAVVFLRSGEPRWYRIGWDGVDVAVMREAGEDFLRRVRDGDPPEADASDATAAALRRRYGTDPDLPTVVCSKSLKRSYIAAIKARKAADDRHQLMTSKIRLLMKDATRLSDPDGGIVATRRGSKGALYPGRDLM